MNSQNGRYTVVGQYRNLQEARQAIDALQDRGIDARDIVVRGPGPARANRVAESTRDSSPRDIAIWQYILTRAIPAALIGSAIGAIVGVIYAGIIGDGSGTFFATSVLSWAVGGFLVGGLLAGMTRLNASRAWESTFEPRTDGDVVVSLRTPGLDAANRAADALHSTDTVRVQRRPR